MIHWAFCFDTSNLGNQDDVALYLYLLSMFCVNAARKPSLSEFSYMQNKCLILSS